VAVGLVADVGAPVGRLQRVGVHYPHVPAELSFFEPFRKTFSNIQYKESLFGIL
jgi:hypothetical protein